MKIEKYSKQYLDQCASLYVEVFNDEPWNDRWNASSPKKRLMPIAGQEDFRGLVSLEDGALTGMVFGSTGHWYDGKIFNIDEICVKKEFRGRGTGRALLGALEDRLRMDGVRLVYVLTARNNYSDRYYLANDFILNENIIVLTKRLGD